MVKRKFFEFYKRILFRFADWYDYRIAKHRYPEFCDLIEDFYEICELGK